MRKLVWWGIAFVLLFVVYRVGVYSLGAVERAWTYQLFGEVVTGVETSERVVALTFDDGPSPPYTDQLLDCLERGRAKATFFVTGRQVERHTESARRIVSRGHELGNHSYSHTSRGSASSVRSEVERTDELLRALGVGGEIHFRTPSGEKPIVTQYVLARMRKKNILWSVSAHDITERDPEKIAAYVVGRVRPGSIVLLHNLPHSVSATELIIKRLREDGYTFKTVSELIELSSTRK